MKKYISIFFVFIFLSIIFNANSHGANEVQEPNSEKKTPEQTPVNISLSKMLTQTIIFLYEDKTPQNSEKIVEGNILGTAFIIGIPVTGNETQFIPFIITAKHVIANRHKILGRYSMSAGGETVFVQYDLDALRESNDLWESKKDEGVDIVAFRSQFFQDTRTLVIPIDLIATKETYASEYIDVADRVMIPCLLGPYPGVTQNYPIFRDGSIALITEEPIEFSWQLGEKMIQTRQKVIFVNATINEGFSGAPVFLWPGVRSTPKGVRFGGKPWLLGVVHGFQSIKRPLKDSDDEFVILKKPIYSNNVLLGQPSLTRDVSVFSQENSAIGFIFPSWQILDILHSDEVNNKVQEISKEVMKTKLEGKKN